MLSKTSLTQRHIYCRIPFIQNSRCGEWLQRSTRALFRVTKMSRILITIMMMVTCMYTFVTIQTVHWKCIYFAICKLLINNSYLKKTGFYCHSWHITQFLKGTRNIALISLLFLFSLSHCNVPIHNWTLNFLKAFCSLSLA